MPAQTRTEELFNSLLHGVGAFAAVLGLLLLIRNETAPLRLFSFSLFSGSMILLFASSCLYHAAANGPYKLIIRKIDYLAIYLLIASTYTPFTLLLLADVRGWSVFILVWLLAVVGILYDLLPRATSHRVIPVTLYLLMGWMALVLAPALLEKLTGIGFAWLVAGGLSYTFGLIFYALDERVSFFHAVWHLFVLAGSAFHFWVVYRYIAQN